MTSEGVSTVKHEISWMGSRYELRLERHPNASAAQLLYEVAHRRFLKRYGPSTLSTVPHCGVWSADEWPITVLAANVRVFVHGWCEVYCDREKNRDR